MELQQPVPVAGFEIGDRGKEVLRVVDRPGREAAHRDDGTVPARIDVFAVALAGRQVETDAIASPVRSEIAQQRKIHAVVRVEAGRVLLAALRGDHVEHAGVSELAVHRRTRAANELDALDLIDRCLQQRAGGRACRCVDRLAVQQQLDLARIELFADAAHEYVPSPGFVEQRDYAGQRIERLPQRAESAAAHLLGVQHADHAGHEIGIQAGLRGERGLLVQEFQELAKFIGLGIFLRARWTRGQCREQRDDRNRFKAAVHTVKLRLRGSFCRPDAACRPPGTYRKRVLLTSTVTFCMPKKLRSISSSSSSRTSALALQVSAMV